MKEKSYMIAVPQNVDVLKKPADILNRLSESFDVNLISHDCGLDGTLQFTVDANGEIYTLEARPIELEIPQMYRTQHFFPDIDIEFISNAKIGLLVSMEFGKEPLESYHAQLKIINEMVPDIVAVIDDSSEKILSGKWVKLAAKSAVPPAPRYIYTVQAVSSGDDGCVWLHSHGMNRCGMPELEILDSSKETYQEHYNVIETLANRLLEMEEPIQTGEPLFLARMTEEIPMVVTLIDWKEAVENYPEDMLGGRKDREEGHNQNTCAVYVYAQYDDIEKRNYSPVSVFDEFMKDNPLYMISTKETERMKKQARERLDYMIKAFENKDNKIIVKIGLEIDEEFRDDQNQHEHIWFELQEVLDGSIKGALIQEPYYVKDMHEGSVGIYDFDKITDWLIYTRERRLTTDDVYLLA